MAKKVIVSSDEGAPIDGTQINQVMDAESVKGKKLKNISRDTVVSEMFSDEGAIKNAEKVTILIHSGLGQLGGEPVFAAVNGVGYSIPRDKPVAVPLPILKALENATETRYYREEVDGKTFGPIISRQVPRFAINHIK
jgi:hypothetical protein